MIKQKNIQHNFCIQKKTVRWPDPINETRDVNNFLK